MKKREVCEQSMCVGCGLCEKVCPQNCIQMQENQEGFFYPQIDGDKCTNCGVCSQKCPQNIVSEQNNAEFYMAWHKDRQVLLESSSGGVFTALASTILKRNGLVAGAYYNITNNNVEHIIIDDIQELEKLRKSKYYQSNLNNIYEEVKKALLHKREVLFSGTACQIAALHSFLGNHIDKTLLTTVDVLCHGVASKKVVSAYINSKEKCYHKKISRYQFRVKEGEKGWESGGGTRMKLYFADGTSVIENQERDTFFVGFNFNLFLRESCYQCQYCGEKRNSDFTLADFWGVSPLRADEEQRKAGISVMLVNTQKAKEMLPKLETELYYTPILVSEVVPYNRALMEPNERPDARDTFFEVMDSKGFDFVVKRFMWKYYMKKYIKSIVQHVMGDKMLSRLKQCKRILCGLDLEE